MTTAQDRFNASPETLRAEFQRTVDNVRNRRDLSGQAQQVAIARAYKAARDGLARAQENDTERYHRQRNFLERKLFGNSDDVGGNNAISSRDARDRAAKLTDPQEAADAYNRAQRDGDRDLTRAIAAHAADYASHPTAPPGWQNIVGHYAQTRPALADTYKELSEMQQPGIGTDFTYVLPMPTELGRLGDHQVDRLAATDLTIHGNGPEAA